MKPDFRSDCPISLALEALGDKWSLLVLRDLMMLGKKRYKEFLESDEGISTNILADRLASLEERGIISKSDDPENGKQYIYSPTKKGLDLVPVIFEMANWAVKHDPHTGFHPHMKKAHDDPKGMMKEIYERFKNVK